MASALQKWQFECYHSLNYSSDKNVHWIISLSKVLQLNDNCHMEIPVQLYGPCQRLFGNVWVEHYHHASQKALIIVVAIEHSTFH